MGLRLGGRQDISQELGIFLQAPRSRGGHDMMGAFGHSLKELRQILPIQEQQIPYSWQMPLFFLGLVGGDKDDQALDQGFDVCVGGEDSSRADPDFLDQVLEVAAKAGARRFRFADTVGVLDPFSIRESFERMRRNSDLELEVHAHDDLGLATANTLAAILGGATHANTTVHGLGERAGNAPFEEVVMGLKHLHGIDTGIDLRHMGPLSELVSNASGRPVPWQKSLVGDGVFTHEAGIHVDGLLKNPLNYQGIDPAEVGREHRIVLGKHSGSRAVQLAYQNLDLSISHSQAEAILQHVRQFSTAAKRAPGPRLDALLSTNLKCGRTWLCRMMWSRLRPSQ